MDAAVARGHEGAADPARARPEVEHTAPRGRSSGHPHSRADGLRHTRRKITMLLERRRGGVKRGPDGFLHRYPSA